VSVLGVFPAVLSEAAILSSGRCCEPNSPHVGAILIVFTGYLFVDTVCEQKMVPKKASIELVISNEVEFS
jgi:hypothetical protein